MCIILVSAKLSRGAVLLNYIFSFSFSFFMNKKKQKKQKKQKTQKKEKKRKAKPVSIIRFYLLSFLLAYDK